MTKSLSGKRILVVEDEYFIASDIKRTLATRGSIIVGPASNLETGLSLAEESIDAAILDVNLDVAMSYPIADRLRTRNVPFMFLTGYDDWSLPADYRDAPRLAKPFSAKTMADMALKLIATAKQTA